MKARPKLNGEVGLLVKPNEKGRWQVRLGWREDILLKEDNVAPLSQEEYEAMFYYDDDGHW